MITATNVCVTLSHQVCHLMTPLSSLKTSNWFTLFSLFQHTPSGYGRADTNPLLTCLIFFYSIPLAVQPFWKSSFCAISSLTFYTLAIFSPFNIPMVRSLKSKKCFLVAALSWSPPPYYQYDNILTRCLPFLSGPEWKSIWSRCVFSDRAWRAAVLFEQHCAHVFLILCCFVHFETLVLYECLFPEHLRWRLVDPNQLAYCWTCRVDFLFFNALMTQTFPMEIVSPACHFRSG